MHLALFSNHLKKTGKYTELWILLITKSVISFAGGSQFYQCSLKRAKALSIYLKRLAFHEKNWRCALRKYSILNSNSNVIWESLVLASDQCLLEIPSETPELRTRSTQGCCMNGSVFSTAMVTQALTGTQGEHHQPSLGPAPSCLGLPCQAPGALQEVPAPSRHPLHAGVPWRPTCSVCWERCSSLPNSIRNAN